MRPKRSRDDTISAIATAPGRGGIGVVRVSGPLATDIAQGILGKLPQPRQARLANFLDSQGETMDQGIALYFKAPHSFTGEDVLELQGHGGPAVLQNVLNRCLELGARLAQPGEFTQRAYLNDKLDLAQAESVADLIDAASAQAAKSAMRSLQGEFSRQVHALVDALINLRMLVESTLDFPEEELDFLQAAHAKEKLDAINAALQALLARAKQGALLREGLNVVLIGQPNVGKSSLLNRLAGDEIAIVTPVAGTTRDTVRQEIQLQGIPLHIIDTAGLRETSDSVEQIGSPEAGKPLPKPISRWPSSMPCKDCARKTRPFCSACRRTCRYCICTTRQTFCRQCPRTKNSTSQPRPASASKPCNSAFWTWPVGDKRARAPSWRANAMCTLCSKPQPACSAPIKTGINWNCWRKS